MQNDSPQGRKARKPGRGVAIRRVPGTQWSNGTEFAMNMIKRLCTEMVQGLGIGALIVVTILAYLYMSSPEFQHAFRCQIFGSEMACFQQAVDEFWLAF